MVRGAACSRMERSETPPTTPAGRAEGVTWVMDGLRVVSKRSEIGVGCGVLDCWDAEGRREENWEERGEGEVN